MPKLTARKPSETLARDTKVRPALPIGPRTKSAFSPSDSEQDPVHPRSARFPSPLLKTGEGQGEGLVKTKSETSTSATNSLKFRPLPRAFFEPTAEQVAPLLLGHYLIHRTTDGLYGGVIVEVEAYLTNDPACHAFKGETPRNRSMWGEHGHAYVYLIYGYHFCVNTVCRPAGIAEGILLRAVQPLWGLEEMRARRGPVAERHLTSGPGKLCSALGITRALDGADLCSKTSPLIVAENPNKTQTLHDLGPLVQTTRIGLSQAADWPLRWYLGGSRFVSKR